MNRVESRSLKDLNTFGVDASTRLFSEVWSEEELMRILGTYKNENILVLGGGSNILFTKDFDGLIIKNSIPGIKIIFEDEDKALIKVGAGVVWNDLVLFCLEQNLGGIENLILIPGTAGAAPIQNIGAYGVEIKDVFHSLKGIYIDKQTEGIFYKEDCKFGYRDSIFKNELKGKFIITYILLELSKKPVLVTQYKDLVGILKGLGTQKPGIKDIAALISVIREEKLPNPSQLGNAGSFFKNPVVQADAFNSLKAKFPDIPFFPAGENHYKIPAAYLIEKSGWKGKREGAVGSYEKQSLIVVNYGGAKGEEILRFARKIKASVKELFGIELQEEVNII